MQFFRTTKGDLNIEQMGITYAHEHLMIDHSYVSQKDPTFLLNDVQKISRELKQCKALGLTTVVDTMPCGCGRNSEKLKDISSKSGVQIIAATGVHLDKYYAPDHWSHYYSVDQMAQLFVDDITVGIDQGDYNGPLLSRSDVKAGLIKFATEEGSFTHREERIIEAVVIAHKITGAPILTHTTNGKMAIEQVERLMKYGANLSHCVLSHVDRNTSISYHREVLESGVSLEYDSIFRWKSGAKNHSQILLKTLLSEFPDQLMVAMDAARNTYWKAYGGSPGMAYLLTDFREWLYDNDLNSYFENIFVNNPKGVFSFEQK